MQEPELYLVFIRPLNELEIPYMITGSMAGAIYGEPRLTHDIDIVIDLQPRWIEHFYDAFNNENFYVPPIEVLNVEAARTHRGHFNLLHQSTGFKADVYIKGKDELHEWAFHRLQSKAIGDHSVFVAPPEYVIIRKLMYYKEGRSEKHLRDIQNILAHNKESIDQTSLKEKMKHYGLQEFLHLFDN
jgi:hypothetical protein